ncbi:unnamed protein product [Arabidopsis thaliana]|uniref:Uncharacterized protein n=1 Tax=Arabidopsis thaliana TaxID=3702 RepID=A0A654EF42_ARATH|nr:unnamed protein product [Arabidopsis thaliana]
MGKSHALEELLYSLKRTQTSSQPAFLFLRQQGTRTNQLFRIRKQPKRLVEPNEAVTLTQQ